LVRWGAKQMPGPGARTVLPAGILGLLTLAAAGPAPSRIAPPAEETLYQSDDLRIYRGTGRHGGPVLVLTNLDPQGNFFPGHRCDAPAVEERAKPSGSPSPPGSTAPAGEAAPHSTPAAQVKVVVNRGDGAAPAGTDEVEVKTDGGGGTTVIINIHPPAPPERQTVVVHAAIGGLVGSFRYPDHLHFLGYGHDTSSPSYFGGLGLNASNRFGLKTGVACERGLDCFFGPARDHP
jgi:hypothetical protein